jgi:hypothetical protein
MMLCAGELGTFGLHLAHDLRLGLLCHGDDAGWSFKVRLTLGGECCEEGVTCCAFQSMPHIKREHNLVLNRSPCM